MKRALCVRLLFFLISILAVAQPGSMNSDRLQWLPWSDAVFAQAQRQHRFVLLDLEAVWCHWCHVMDEKTYRDPEVIRLLQSRYIVVKVDQDSRPDLSNRYEDYGWPATVVFDAERHEIVKRQGYLPPDVMASMLHAIIQDPSPGPSVRPESRLALPAAPLLNAGLRRKLIRNYVAGYDQEQGSWGTNQKLLDWDSVEYSMALAEINHDLQAEHRARQTLDGGLHLLDPVWGGVYQYSAGSDWNSPHFEKVMQMQAENLRIYSLAYARWHDPAYLHAAREIRRFLDMFLSSPDGAFFTSQDADLKEGEHSAGYFALDDAGRRRMGIPRIDTHTYARENGWAITGLVALYSASLDRGALDEASQAAHWVLANRSLPGGGFRHGESDSAGPYLGDSIAMARALIALYAATGERQWLTQAEATMHFIRKSFPDSRGIGFLTSTAILNHGLKPKQQRDENTMTARTANLLFHYTGNPAYREIARQAMRYLSADPIVYRLPASSVLLADMEIRSTPVHVSITGPKSNAKSAALFRTEQGHPVTSTH